MSKSYCVLCGQEQQERHKNNEDCMREYNKQLTNLEKLGLEYEADVQEVAQLQKDIEKILGEVESLDVQIKLEDKKIKENDLKIQELNFRLEKAKQQISEQQRQQR